jgi:hypothetical protein
VSWETGFEELAEYYPGSSKKIQRNVSSDAQERQPDTPAWDLKPRRLYELNGIKYEVFSIGDLAVALEKRPVTIRLWETKGFIPTTMRAPSNHQEKRQRIYSRAQIEGIVRIAQEEGILHQAKPRVEKTNFKEKVLDLFLELAELPMYGALPLDEDK